MAKSTSAGPRASRASEFTTLSLDTGVAVSAAGYQTFRLVAGSPSGEAGVQRQIRGAIVGQLAMRGLELSNGEADLAVVTHVIDYPQRPLRGWFQWRRSGNWKPVGGEDRTRRTVIVDVFDTAGDRLIWCGMATDLVTGEARADARSLVRSLHLAFESCPLC